MNASQIVLIEDNPGDVFLVEMALKVNGIPYRLMRFDTGEAALRVLCAPEAANDFVPEAILLDLNTPGRDGFEVLTKLKQTPHLYDVPIAILTSSQANSDKQRAALQSTRYIQKPSHLREFLDQVGHAVKEMLHPKC